MTATQSICKPSDQVEKQARMTEARKGRNKAARERGEIVHGGRS